MTDCRDPEEAPSKPFSISSGGSGVCFVPLAAREGSLIYEQGLKEAFRPASNGLPWTLSYLQTAQYAGARASTGSTILR